MVVVSYFLPHMWLWKCTKLIRCLFTRYSCVCITVHKAFLCVGVSMYMYVYTVCVYLLLLPLSTTILLRFATSAH